MKLDPARYLTLLRSDGAALADAAEQDPAASVAAFDDDYDVASLVTHTGGVHRWFIACLAADAYVAQDQLAPPPADYIGWFRAGVDELATILEQRGADDPTWTWGSVATTGFWYRRAAHETAVHRWDAQAAVGSADPIDAELAVDGVDELFDEMLPRRSPSWAAVVGDEAVSASVHLHATDAEGEWMLVLGGEDGLVVTREHAKGDVAAKGAASDLLLMLYSRVDIGVVDLFGDRELLSRWQAHVSI